MTIRLTLKCSSGCKHCLVNSTPNSGSMDINTLNNILKLLEYINIPIINISGGEITEMDNWFDTLNYIIKFIKDKGLRSKLLVLSNGSFIFDDIKFKDVISLVGDNVVDKMIVSTNPTFYKNSQVIFNNIKGIHPKILVNSYDRINVLKNLGRAKSLRTNPDTPASCNTSCKVIRLKPKTLHEVFNSFPPGVCSPMINIDGNIFMGWSDECRCVGNINSDSYQHIYMNMINFIPCGKCKQLIEK